MEGGRKPAGSSSSFSSDLFGAKYSSSSSVNANFSSSMSIFDSVFSPPSTILGRESSRSDVIGSWRKQDSGHQAWNTKKDGSQGNTSQSNEGENHGLPKKDQNSIFQDERIEPCFLSSSLYYGGQDIYSNSSSTRASGSSHVYKKDVGEDDPNGSNLNSASRGNWWQGSLYY